MNTYPSVLSLPGTWLTDRRLSGRPSTDRLAQMWK